MNLKEKVKSTLLLDYSVKKKILSIKWKIPKKLEEYLSIFFEKYENKEKNIIDDVLAIMPMMYLKTIQQIEKKHKEKEKNDLIDLENKIEKLL